MSENKSVHLFIGALSFLAGISPVLASQESHSPASEQRIATLNAASLKSIESTWLKVPNACKARAFHASPVALESSEARFHIQSIYASFVA